MRMLIHILLVLALLIQPLPRVCASAEPCTPALRECCCCAEQAGCPCEPVKNSPPMPELRPCVDLFPATPPIVLDLAGPVLGPIRMTQPRLAYRGGSPSLQSLLCVWRT